jgi:PAS domain S-box-containing protein
MDGFWMVDMRGWVLDVNDAYCHLVGYSRNKMLKMNITDIEVREKSPRIMKRLQKIRNTEKDRFLTQHRKNNGEIIDVEVSAHYVNRLGGFVFFFIRDISELKKTEDEMAKNIANSKKEIEIQLAESYEQLGIINRKISLLSELSNFSKSKKDRQNVTDHILNLAMNISKAPAGYLYGLKTKGRFNLLSYKGVEEEQKEKIKMIATHTVGFLRCLIKERGLMNGDIERYGAEFLALDNRLEYFVTLPLLRGASLGGFIFLGFGKAKSVDTQDLEFLDVFSVHASNALGKAGVLKW